MYWPVLNMANSAASMGTAEIFAIVIAVVLTIVVCKAAFWESDEPES